MIIAPVQDGYPITQDYGKNPDIYKKIGLKYGVPLQSHDGQDIGIPVGTAIYAPIDGVVETGYDENGYGYFIRIRGHSYNSLGDYREILLAHLSQFGVESGTEVKAGDQIALSGNTGFSTGPHLHWAMRRRNKQDEILNYQQNCGYENIFSKGWILSHRISNY